MARLPSLSNAMWRGNHRAQSTDAFQSVRVQLRDLTRGPKTGVHDALIGRERNSVRRRREFPVARSVRWQMDEIQPATLSWPLYSRNPSRERPMPSGLAPQFVYRSVARLRASSSRIRRFPGRYVHAIPRRVNRQLVQA